MESRDLICQWCNLNGVNLPAVACIECECKWKCHRLYDAASHHRTIWCTKLAASMTLHIQCKFISQIIISHTAFGHSYVHLSLHINNNNSYWCAWPIPTSHEEKDYDLWVVLSWKWQLSRNLVPFFLLRSLHNAESSRRTNSSVPICNLLATHRKLSEAICIENNVHNWNLFSTDCFTAIAVIKNYNPFHRIHISITYRATFIRSNK